MSHKYKFIYLHCRKTAGTSVVISLARSLGLNDLQLSGIVDGIEFGVHPPARMIWEAVSNPGVRPAVRLFTRRLEFWPFVAGAVKQKYEKKLGPVPQHAPALRVAEVFSDEWSSYLKFTIVRNPWTQVVSDYIWQFSRQNYPFSFQQYIDALFEEKTLPGMGHYDRANWNKYTINDQIAVDRVVFFENLASDLQKTLSETDLSWDGWLPNAKKIVYKQSDDYYKDFYDRETKEKVRMLYEQEIDTHGYSF